MGGASFAVTRDAMPAPSLRRRSGRAAHLSGTRTGAGAACAVRVADGRRDRDPGRRASSVRGIAAVAPARCRAVPVRGARWAFEPRAYQLVPLLMALRLPVVRLLIADDVGIGKTIEAGLILRELIDRGEADRFAVLCPPHLVEQWTGELESKV